MVAVAMTDLLIAVLALALGLLVGALVSIHYAGTEAGRVVRRILARRLYEERNDWCPGDSRECETPTVEQADALAAVLLGQPLPDPDDPRAWR